MVKQVTELHQIADVVAVADYSVIPKYLFGDSTKYTDWYVGFATNGMTFVYTARSKFASEITGRNWYEVLSRPGTEIGRSNPDTDPSGYQTVQMLELAEKYYNRPGLASAVLANAPKRNMRDTETELHRRPRIRPDRLPGDLSFRCAPASFQVPRSSTANRPRRREVRFILRTGIRANDKRHPGRQAHRLCGDNPEQCRLSRWGAHVRAISPRQCRSGDHSPQRLRSCKDRVRERREQGARRIEIARKGMAGPVKCG